MNVFPISDNILGSIKNAEEARKVIDLYERAITHLQEAIIAEDQSWVRGKAEMLNAMVESYDTILFSCDGVIFMAFQSERDAFRVSKGGELIFCEEGSEFLRTPIEIAWKFNPDAAPTVLYERPKTE